jgi:hypothetical protein
MLPPEARAERDAKASAQSAIYLLLQFVKAADKAYNLDQNHANMRRSATIAERTIDDLRDLLQLEV